MTSRNDQNRQPGKLLPRIVYPSTMAACVLLHLSLLKSGVPLVLSAYAGIVLGAIGVTAFERIMPERREWQADRRMVWNDLLFMAFVQMALPKMLGLVAAVTLVAGMARSGWSATHLWVHHWPVWAQAVLMLLVADFLRYWFHVASHRWPLLWRLHAVHHSPEKLYWLNVGRFHPIEKAFQFLLDALPFILVGVGQDVLALYFVFYAVNGFFQHCNIHLRLGWLNHVISGPELHRWHHSRVIGESNSNYGNNTIVWDILFGTRFLPAHREVGNLGLRNPEYPTGFGGQIRAPFVPDLDHVRVPACSWGDILLNGLLHVGMIWVRWRHFLPLERAACDPAKEQQKVLRRILRAQRDTEFVREHGLEPDMGIAAFRTRVPVTGYEELRPWIERQDQTGARCLNASKPVMFNVTSGTSGRPKYLPVVRRALKALATEQSIFILAQYRSMPSALRGRMLGIVGASVEGTLPSGTPYGSASGRIYAGMPLPARAKYVLPAEVFEIEDYFVRYYAILRLSLAHRDITYMGTANPTTFLRLLDLFVEHRETLLRDIEKGTFHHLEGISGKQRAILTRRCSPDFERARELRIATEARQAVGFPDLWPYLSVVTTWTGGSCGVTLASLRTRLSPATSIVELGYLSSELRVTITIDPANQAGVPTLRDNFFEFVERDEWERAEPRFLTLAEIGEGRSYYLFVTTPSGLYRYPMNDIVEVSGRFHNTPMLRFMQKGIGVTNITGEKVYECQAMEAIRAAGARQAVHLRFYQVLADEEAVRYRVFAEPDRAGPVEAHALANAFDESLGKLNLEYQEKRRSGRLKAPEMILLQPGTWEKYKDHCLAQGMREAQFKTVTLRYRRDFDFDFSPFILTMPPV